MSPTVLPTRRRQQGLRGRHVLVVFLGFFAAVFLVNGAMIYSAVSTHTGLVANEPYRKGLHYNERIAADERQARLGWTDALRGRPRRPRALALTRARRPPGARACRLKACWAALPPTATTSSCSSSRRRPGRYEAQTAPLARGQLARSRSRRARTRPPRPGLPHAEAHMAQALSTWPSMAQTHASRMRPRRACKRDDLRRMPRSTTTLAVERHALRRLHAQGRAGARRRSRRRLGARANLSARRVAAVHGADRRQQRRPRRGARPRRLQGRRARRGQRRHRPSARRSGFAQARRRRRLRRRQHHAAVGLGVVRRGRRHDARRCRRCSTGCRR